MLQKNVFYASGLKGFYRVLAGRAFFLLTAKETKLPARNFFIQVSSWAGSVPSQKIDHAGQRAERRNGGLAFPGGHSNYISSSFFNKNDSLAIATMLSGLGNDGRRKR
ncbi:hypothetical protein [Pedobacter sp. CFBP9032]|uniref:hypothetical protein n=1 Tax=Pedobacter sp. CFBP9032 TaxID=3096539 RepID=UPI002A6B69FF|nr:hypothetical protein [Pedobacter sp. CFBP9032]MDY0906888.1 hypothetical protein [Pedobacter sp. CFBP9032]